MQLHRRDGGNVVDASTCECLDFVTAYECRWQWTLPTGVVAVLQCVNGSVCVDVDCKVVECSAADSKHSEGYEVEEVFHDKERD